ncbi:MAG: hypothetical protein U7123_07165 [Potamolinea sp.]
MAYWIKVNHERNEYVVDLDRLSAFVCAPNGKITFWLPNSAIPMILNQQSNPDGYQQVLDYVQQVSTYSLSGSWIQINYERNDYVIDLNRISSFCYSPSGRITFWLPDSSIPIIINEQKNPDTYLKLLEFIKRKTGHLIP